jgi:hypothetical protein
MADISKITTPDGTAYDIKDETAREHCIYYGTCGTAAATAAKVATVNGVTELKTGITIAVKFTYTNTIANPTLNVNSLGAKSIKRYGTTAPSTSAASAWNAGSVVTLTYDGTYWQMHDWNNSTYSALSDADMKAGTATASRLITAARLKEAVEYHAPVTSVNGNTGDVTVSVPTKVSELTNDSGFITGYTETDPTVPSWAKASSKPSYTASEVGAVPTTRKVNGKALSSDIEIGSVEIPMSSPWETVGAVDVQGALEYLDSNMLTSETDPVFTASAAHGISSSDISNWNSKQAALVSGTNIKTVNSTSLLGSGNVAVQPTLVSGTNIKTINNQSILGSGNLTIGGTGTEVDPVFTASAAYGISSNDILHWDNATEIVVGSNKYPILSITKTTVSGVSGVSVRYDDGSTDGVLLFFADGVGLNTVKTAIESEIPTVPTDISAFTNDVGYLTSYTETDPTVPSWAKQTSKPSYTASEVGAQPTLVSGTNIKTVNGNSLLGSGNIEISGGISVSDFEIVEHSFSVSSISSGGGSGVKEATFTKAGYYPLALVGFQTGENDALFTRCKLTNQASGTVKLSYYIRAVAAVSSTTGYVDILWVKE